MRCVFAILWKVFSRRGDSEFPLHTSQAMNLVMAVIDGQATRC